MTKKDFTLIADAVNEAVQDALQGLEERLKGVDLVCVENRFRLALSNAFAERLRYTNDKFDSNSFRIEINGRKYNSLSPNSP